MGDLTVATITCPYIEQCEDGKAPYRLPNMCCDQCGMEVAARMNHSSQGFRFADYLVALRAIIVSPEEKMDSWSEWSDWTRCSLPCGSGRQSRMRECIVTDKAAINCTGERVQIQECNTHHCPSKKKDECNHSLHACRICQLQHAITDIFTFQLMEAGQNGPTGLSAAPPVATGPK